MYNGAVRLHEKQLTYLKCFFMTKKGVKMKRIYITGVLAPEDKGLVFDDMGKAINYLQKKGYTDREICLVRFVPVN